MVDIYENILKKCQSFIDKVDEQNNKLIIYLDHENEWLEVIKTKCKGDQKIVLISDTEEFRAFIQVNGCSKMFININFEPQNGIDLAEELGLKDFFGDLIFVSSDELSKEDLARIDKLGAKFVSKSILLKQVIYLKGA